MKQPSYLLSAMFLVMLSIVFFGFLNLKPLKENELLEKLKQKLEIYNHHLPGEKVYLHFDKPFYKPGDDIWFSAYLRNGIDHKASTISEIITVELINPKGSIEKAIRIIAKNGTAQGDFAIGAGMPGGMYKIKAYTNWMKNEGEGQYFEKELQVQSVVLPKLLMNLEFERKAYGAGEDVVANLKLATLSNTVLSNHSFNFVAQLNGKDILNGKSMSDENGKALIRFKLPKKLESNDGLLNIMIAYEGSHESISRAIPIVLNNIDLQFFPEGGDLIADVESKVAFKALNEFGKPADIEGVVFNEMNEKVGEFKSFHQGMGAFTITPKRSGRYKVKIIQPENINKTYVLPPALSAGYRLSLTHQKPGLAQAKVYSPFATTLALVAQVRGEIYYSKEINVQQGDNLISIPLADFPAGVAQFSIFDQKEIARCERLLFVNQHKKLKVEISTDKEKYLPREKVNMTVKVLDENGLPAPGNFSLSVVDDKLISFANDKQANIMSYLLLQSDIRGKVEEPDFYFDAAEPKAAEALDYLLLTQGWRRFEWKSVLSTNEIKLKNSIQFPAEKAIVKGKVISSKDQHNVANAKVTVLETEEVTFTDRNGKFEFNNLDLSMPRTLQVIDDKGQERIIQINDYAQEYLIGNEVRGRIVSKEDGEPLPGVTINFKGTNVGTITDMNGDFNIKIPEQASTLVFSYIGYESEEIPVANRNVIDLKMTEDIRQLQEMVVVGFGAERRRKNLAVQNIMFEEVHQAELDVIVKVEKQELVNEPVAAEMLVFDDFIDFEIPAEEEVAEVFTIVEQMPEYPGGMKQLYEFIGNNIKYPQDAIDRGISGKVYVQFIVLEDGSIADVVALKGIGAGCDEEAIRVIAKIPGFRPAMQRGAAVKTRMVLPVTYNIDNYIQNQAGLMFQVASQAKYGMQAIAPKYHRAREFYQPKYKKEDKVTERNDFRKTIYWNPSIAIDRTGFTELSFYNSDEVTTFRATIEGLGDEGLVGRSEYTYFTQLPFSMDTKIPEVLAFEDKVSIPVTLKNNTDKTITGTLRIETPRYLALVKKWDDEISVAPRSAKTLFIDYEVLAMGAGSGKINFSFVSDGLKDSFEQPIEIKAKGFPTTASFSGNEVGKSFELEISNMVPQSLRARLTAYPDVLSDLMAGVESILQEPYGCFEQASSSTYPNILALQYMENSDNIDSKVREKALALIDKGYKKLIAYETKQEGYEWFGQTPPHEGLTAYGLMEFKDMDKVYASVDKKMMQRTAKWIMDRRDGKGGFLKSNRSVDSFGRASEAVSNAYIVYALSESGYKELGKELDLAQKNALSSGDAYQLALVNNSLYNVGRQKEGDDLLKTLIGSINKHGIDGLPADHSITMSGGKSLKVETASLVAMAILKSGNKDIKSLQAIVDYLVKSRSNYGGFGSTQATILALKALTEYAQFSKKTATSGTIEIMVDGNQVASKFYEKGTKGEIVMEGLEKFIDEGTRSIHVKYINTNDPLPYSMDISWSTYTPVSNKECKVDLQTSLNKKSSKVGETVRLTAKLKNMNQGGIPMTVALLGIPSGLSVQPWQLKELLDNKKVDFYEIHKNYLVLYYTQLAPGAEHVVNLDLKAEIPGDFEAPASSAYLYYTNEHKVWTGGERIKIEN